MEANSSLAVRVTGLERAVNRLETLEPAVVRQQVLDMKDDIAEIKENQRNTNRILIGFLVTFAFAACSTTVAIVMLLQS